ncbi:MAG: winged helix-turn-helix domain-containing protein [Phycisphaerae bacterium]|nr:winged helix-turn-helix domain-containing protein [Phycisphaerae bacterium]
MHSRVSAAPPANRQRIGGKDFAVHSDGAASNGLTDGLLLRICRVRRDDPHVTAEWIATLRQVASVFVEPPLPEDAQLESAMTLLASALGQLPQFNPTHLPFGYRGPQVPSRDWIEREALERVGIQLVGLLWQKATAETVADVVERAVSEGVRLGFLEQQQYDAWRPGMPSGSGWRLAVTATPYGVARAIGLIESLNEAPLPGAPEPARIGPEGESDTVTDSSRVGDETMAADDPSHNGPDSVKEPYRERLFTLCKARGLWDGEPGPREDRDAQQAAMWLADELEVWVEAISDADADRHPAGGYGTMLAADLEEMLGPSELTYGVFQDDWTPLLTQLRMSGLSELAERLECLADEVLPQAQGLARHMDAVAYLRNGGPRDVFYGTYAEDDLVTHEACAWQSRQDVARSVTRIVGTLRTFANGLAGKASAAAAMPNRTQKAGPRRGTRAANIEKLEKELETHLLAARDHAQSLRDRGLEPILLPRPSQKELADRTGLEPPTVSRCLKDQRATVLKILWETADSLEAVMRYKGRR